MEAARPSDDTEGMAYALISLVGGILAGGMAWALIDYAG
jgi:hypothetical protein